MIVEVKFTISTSDFGKEEFRKEIKALIKDIDPETELINFDMYDITPNRRER